MKKLVLGCLLSVLMCFNAYAKPQYEFDVSVDVTAENVVEAKKQAMEKAMRDGINNVLLMVSTESSISEFEKLNSNQLQHFIAGVMVLMEKASDVRYIADLRITVDGDVLKAYLKENMLPIVVGEEQDVLVVPVMLQKGGKADLWGNGNIWREAFVKQRDLKKGNLNIQVIEKNLGNITLLDASRFYDMTEAEYSELSSFNRMETIYVAQYMPDDNKVMVKSYPQKEETEILIDDKSLEMLIDDVLGTFRDVKKETQIEQNSGVVAEEKMFVLFTYKNLGEWVKLKRHLETYPQIQNIKVISMMNGKVHFSCMFNGVIEKLQGKLIVNGYNFRKEGAYYVISK